MRVIPASVLDDDEKDSVGTTDAIGRDQLAVIINDGRQGRHGAVVEPLRLQSAML